MNPTFDRRKLLLAGALAATAPAATLAATDEETLELWPGGAPGGERVSVREELEDLAPGAVPRDRVAQHVTRPLLTLFRPKADYNGATLLVVPGGGYRRVVIDREGVDTAEWLAARGFAAGVLRYRLPADGWAAGPDAPLHDAMRALRLLRAHAPAGTRRIGAIGFSAGGHVVARLITETVGGPARSDAADELSARPDFAVLMYPVIATTGDAAHSGSVQQLIGAGVAPTDLALARYSAHLNVSAQTPPTMLVHAADDKSVPVENSLVMYDALRARGVRSELHVFDQGGHGFGLRSVAGKNVAIWPNLVQNWALGDATPKS
jgi:acetyl esterase/lipase